MNNVFDLNEQPLIAVWETNPRRDENRCQSCAPGKTLELTDAEAEKLIREVADLKPPVFVFAGANPLERDHIFSLVRYASSCGLHPHMSLTARPSLTRETLALLKSSGLSRLRLNLHGASPAVHESTSGVPDSFLSAIKALQWANEIRLPVQVHTDLCRQNLNDLENVATLLKGFRILSWTVAFPVAADPCRHGEMLSAQEFEDTFERLYLLAQQVSFKIKTAEAEHYRRFIVQQRARARAGGYSEPHFAEDGIPGILPITESRASIYIDSTGEVYPSQSLPVVAGNIRQQKLTDIYRNSDLLRALRDLANLKGKCGGCEFKQLCGGSRARAFAATGDIFSQDESCVYTPSPVLKEQPEA